MSDMNPCACLPSRIQNLRMMLGVPPQPVRVHIAKPKAPAPVTSSEFSHPHYRHQPRIRIIFPVSFAATRPLDQSPTRQIKGWKLESRLATSEIQPTAGGIHGYRNRKCRDELGLRVQWEQPQNSSSSNRALRQCRY